MDSYSESFSSNDEESSNNRTVTVDSDSSATLEFEEVQCKWEADSKGIEATLHKIAVGPKCSRGISNLSLPYV